METPRVRLLPVDEAVARAGSVDLLAPLAELNVFRVLLHHPHLAKAIADLLAQLLWKGSLDTRLRELVIMRMGWRTASDYEWTQHWKVATDLGVDPDDLVAVRDWERSDRFSDADRAVLAATDQVLDTGTIDEATWKACEQHVGGPAELLELTAAIGTWRLISGMLRSLDIPLEDGVASWPPDGRAPRTARG